MELAGLLNEQVWLIHELVADGQGNVHWLAVNGIYRHWTPSDGWSEAVKTGETGLGNARLAVDAEGRARVVFTAADGVYVTEQGTDGTWAEPRVAEPSRGTAIGAVVLAIDEEGRSHIVLGHFGGETSLPVCGRRMRRANSARKDCLRGWTSRRSCQFLDLCRSYERPRSSEGLLSRRPWRSPERDRVTLDGDLDQREDILQEALLRCTNEGLRAA